MPADLAPNTQKRQQVLSRLESPVKNRDDLLRLFVSTLGYRRVESPIPVTRDTFGEGIALELAQKFRPVRLAEAGSFQIVYTELDGDRLDYWRQRVLATKLLETFQDSLFVFLRAGTLGDSLGAEAHLVNVRTADRRVFRRFKLGPGERYRTTAERLALLDISQTTDLSTLAIRARHEAAFDVEPVTRKFFNDFCAVFELVCKEMRLQNKGLDAEGVERETQTLLDRLLFLYFIQRKGWLNRQRDYLYAHFKTHYKESPNGYSYLERFLRPLFVKLSTEGEMAEIAGHDLPFLNGGLFADEYGAEQREEAQHRRANLKIGNAIFQHVFEDLLEVYNFTVREDTPLNQEVAIDPEMLGKIFESLVLQIEQTDTTGKTSRHDTGSHYTPRPIVHYLCREGLRMWLEQSPPDPARAQDWPERLARLLVIDASDGIDPDEQSILESCITPAEAQVVLKRIDELRACDLAVGSGAFPVGLLLELVNLTRLCETRLRSKDPVDEDREWLFNTKSRFIQRVIYGVDIQDRAIEICKLRLWLSLMVDHPLQVDVDKCSVKDFRAALKTLPALPNLDFKIRRANSLIDQIHGERVALGRIAEEDKTLPPILNRLTSAKRDFYEAHRLADKRRLRFDILDAGAELAMLELSRAKLSLGLIVDESDAAAMQRLREIDRATKEMALYRDQIAAARKAKAQQQDEALERLTGQFNAPDKPTFVCQLDFAEVFHRQSTAPSTHGHGNGDLLTSIGSDKGAALHPSGFDLMVGNPPYIRIQVLKDSAPQDAEFFKEHYRSAGKGNYDVYVVFVERSLQLLNDNGVLAFILPHKFFNAQYGEPLREILSKGRHLSHVVHFGDQQIFPGATNYVCLLFLAKPGCDTCRWVRADNLPDWLNTFKAPETKLASGRLTAAEWNFSVGKNAGLFDKLQQMPIKLGDVVEKIYQGLATSADSIFVMRQITRHGKLTKLYSQALDENVEIEADLLHPLLKGAEITRFVEPQAALEVLFPYRLIDGEAVPLQESEIRKAYPAAYDYFRQNKRALLQRSKTDESNWWLYPYPKNLALYAQPKVIIQVLSTRGTCFLDDKGKFYFLGGGTAGGNALKVTRNEERRLKFMVALLNSRITTYYVSNVASGFRGGFFAFGKGSLDGLPLPVQDNGGLADEALVGLVENIISAKRTDPDADTAALEGEIDERVYKLYGLTPDEIRIIEEATAP